MSCSLAASGRVRERRTLLFARDLDQMQNSGEQRVRLAGTADVDDAGALKLAAEHVDHQLGHVVVERAKCAVDEHPGGHLYQDAGQGEAQLLVLAQFPIPSTGLVEHGREALEAQPVKSTREGARAETLGLLRICENLAQSSPRQIRGS